MRTTSHAVADASPLTPLMATLMSVSVAVNAVGTGLMAVCLTTAANAGNVLASSGASLAMAAYSVWAGVLTYNTMRRIPVEWRPYALAAAAIIPVASLALGIYGTAVISGSQAGAPEAFLGGSGIISGLVTAWATDDSSLA